MYILGLHETSIPTTYGEAIPEPILQAVMFWSGLLHGCSIGGILCGPLSYKDVASCAGQSASYFFN